MTYIVCGDHFNEIHCYGDGAYCCGLRNEECCWGSDLGRTSWWVWFGWFWIILAILACAVCICVCRRRRHAAQPRYVIIDEGQTSYGTVPRNYNYVASAAVPNMATAPQPPTYQEKPPDYTAVASR